MNAQALRVRSRVLMWLVTIPFAALALLALLQFWFMGKFGRDAVGIIILYGPMYIYIAALWMVRQALGSIARGDLFGRVAPRLLFRVGLALFAGALFEVFGRPAAMILSYGSVRPLAERGLMTGEVAVTSITLGVVGATLMVVSHLLARASELRRELDEFV